MLNVLLYVKNQGKANHGACHYLKCHTGSQDIKWIRTKANNEITNFGQFSQSLNRIRLFVTPWTAGHQASLSITNSRNLLKLVFMESIVPSNHLILCHPLLLPPSIFHSIRVFSSESFPHTRWPNYWSFSFSISPSNEYQHWFLLGWTDWISLQSKGLSRVFSNITLQNHQFFGAQLFL